jgi:DNA-binding transcriptional ArsR family regulator
MSLGVGRGASRAQLRALAHPIRLRMLSLLTGAAMTAAEVARELGLTHANASYHLRQLHASGVIRVVGAETIRGGVAKRYRYPLEKAQLPEGDRDYRAVHAALAAELRRRSAYIKDTPGRAHLTDAELWVDPEVWADVRRRVNEASNLLHRAAMPPRTAGTIRVNATVALFEMETDA